MDSLFMASVGHGQTFAFGNRPDGFAQVDWGGESAARALAAVDRIPTCRALILTHFHLDHYWGLMKAATGQPVVRFPAEDLWIPRLPDFPERREFSAALACIILREARHTYGLDEFDARQWYLRVTGDHGTIHHVSRGDEILVGRRRLQVLWPPRDMASGGGLRVRKALNLFREALEQDPDLREAHALVVDRDTDFWEGRVQEFGEPAAGGVEGPPSAATKKANDALRKVANRLCLVFRDRRRLLALGDLELKEIRTVCSTLWDDGFGSFSVMTAPHHGTRWPSHLMGPRAHTLLVSNGEKSHKRFESALNRIATQCLSTHTCHDIVVHYDDHLVLPAFCGSNLRELDYDSAVGAFAIRPSERVPEPQEVKDKSEI